MPGDGFPWPDGDVEGDDSPVGELPSHGPLAEFRRAAIILSRPQLGFPDRPWVLARGDRAVKAYDTRALGIEGQRRAREEARSALLADGIPGVVRTYRAEPVGHWIVIEMERQTETLDHFLGHSEPLPPERWGKLFEGVAVALQEIHRRGQLHRDIKPDNLMFDDGRERLLIADFSIAAPRRRAHPDARGTDRYVAPEVFNGRIGPASDQYALGVVAADAIGPDAGARADRVLARACAHDPDDRFSDVATFGSALRASVDPSMPSFLSTRLEAVSATWRHTWGLGAVASLAAYAYLCALRSPSVTWWMALWTPLVVAGLTMVAARGSARLRRQRTRARLAIADRPWFALAVFSVLIAGLAPLIAFDPAANAKYAYLAGASALAIAATLGSTPPQAGSWLIRGVRRWERYRTRRVGRWLARAAALAAAVLLAALPPAIAAWFPRTGAPSHADAYEPLRLVAAAREALLSDAPASVCRLTRVPAREGAVDCPTWAALAGGWMRSDVAEGHARGILPSGLHRLRVEPDSTADLRRPPDASLVTFAGGRREVGWVEHAPGTESVLGITVLRDPSSAKDRRVGTASWRYELVRMPSGWTVTAIEFCDNYHEPACLAFGQIKASELRQTLRAWRAR